MALSDVSGLSIYRKTNPYERRAAVGMQMMKQSGYAAPLVAAATGKSIAQAEQWDADQETKGLELLRESRRQQMAQAEFKNVLDLSKTDAPAATQLLNAITKQYPELQPFAGIKFTNETTEKGWAQVELEDGQKLQVHLPSYFKASKEGDQEGMKKAVVNLGDIGIKGNRSGKRDKEIEIGVGGDNVSKAVYEPDNPNADENGYVLIGKPYPKHSKSIPGQGGGAPPLKSTQISEIRREVVGRFLPMIGDDIKKDIGDYGSDPALSRVRTGLPAGAGKILDEFHEELEDAVSKGSNVKKASNKLWPAYEKRLQGLPKPAPPAKPAEGPGMGEKIVEGVKGLFKGAGGNNDQPPPEVLADMKPGTQREFANGQIWQKDAQGNVSRIY